MLFFITILNTAATIVILLYMLAFFLLSIGYRGIVTIPESPHNRVLAGIIIALITYAAIRGVWL